MNDAELPAVKRQEGQPAEPRIDRGALQRQQAAALRAHHRQREEHRADHETHTPRLQLHSKGEGTTEQGSPATRHEIASGRVGEQHRVAKSRAQTTQTPLEAQSLPKATPDGQGSPHPRLPPKGEIPIASSVEALETAASAKSHRQYRKLPDKLVLRGVPLQRGGVETDQPQREEVQRDCHQL